MVEEVEVVCVEWQQFVVKFQVEFDQLWVQIVNFGVNMGYMQVWILEQQFYVQFVKMVFDMIGKLLGMIKGGQIMILNVMMDKIVGVFVFGGFLVVFGGVVVKLLVGFGGWVIVFLFGQLGLIQFVLWKGFDFMKFWNKFCLELLFDWFGSMGNQQLICELLGIFLVVNLWGDIVLWVNCNVYFG